MNELSKNCVRKSTPHTVSSWTFGFAGSPDNQGIADRTRRECAGLWPERTNRSSDGNRVSRPGRHHVCVGVDLIYIGNAPSPLTPPTCPTEAQTAFAGSVARVIHRLP